MYQDQLIILLDMGIAVILGGIIGFEREWKHKPAGFRTNMIIAAASALFISLGRVIVEDFGVLRPEESYGIDPTRMMHAVIVGVSFLGAGTILKSSNHSEIKYLTTSASILVSSAIGIGVALKQYLLAVGATVILLIINRFFRYVRDKITGHKEGH